MMIQFLLNRFKEHAQDTCVIWHGKNISYGEMLTKYEQASSYLSQSGITSGKVVSITGDFTPNTISLILALIQNKNIIVPFANPIKETELVKFDIAEVECKIEINLEDDSYTHQFTDKIASHIYYAQLKENKRPGLVLFTSGTSGFPKGAVHDFSKLLVKFETLRKSLRTVNFLLFDHWGGLNTLFHTLSNCGVVLALRERKPEAICNFVEQYKIELLPVSPSFLNLLILSESYKNFDLSSLKLISYGTEPMPENTLKKAKELFPSVTFQQTYGLIELGVLRSKSKSDDSLWVKIGGEGFVLRVVEGILQIKADSAMIGYLNAPSPFTEDGYFITGDMVEQDGEYFKILGRKSEIINVGGEKVYPQEVENVVIAFKGVKDVIVYSEKHPITGNIVCAKINVDGIGDERAYIKELKQYCKQSLQSFKVPVKIQVIGETLHSNRFKKQRNK
jgi:acyl-coenzyme A synthetase/AMP-(fatty) acid ligase